MIYPQIVKISQFKVGRKERQKKETTVSFFPKKV